MKRTLLSLALATGGLVWTGCATTPTTAPPRDRQAADIAALERYYKQATSDHYLTARQPIRDKQERALRLLAKTANEMLAEVHTWDTDARLVSVNEADRPAAHESVGALASALGQLKAAADHGNLARVRSEYSRTTAAYDDVVNRVGLPN